MLRQIDTEVDFQFEYKDHLLKFQMVPVTGTIEWGLATREETSWSEFNLHIGLTVSDVQFWVVEMFEDEDQPVPYWAYTDGQAILDEMKERLETHIDLG